MTIENVKQRRAEALKELEALTTMLKGQDERVESKSQEYRKVAFEVQARLEHRQIDKAEAAEEIDAAWRALTEARLQRIEECFVTTSKMNAALLNLIAEMLGLFSE